MDNEGEGITNRPTEGILRITGDVGIDNKTLNCLLWLSGVRFFLSNYMMTFSFFCLITGQTIELDQNRITFFISIHLSQKKKKKKMNRHLLSKRNILGFLEPC